MLKFVDNFPLKNITTLQIGGPAKKFVVVKTEEELMEAIRYAKTQQMPHLVIGRGSNLLVADEGVNSLVIKNEIVEINDTPPRSNFVTPRRWPHGLLRGENEGVTLKVKSGTPLQKLVDYTIAHGLAGLEKLTGIPGTVGGAVYGNAGAYGQTISDHLAKVVVIHSSSLRGASNNERRGNLLKKECGFGYRDSIFKKSHDTILEVLFQLQPGNKEELEQEAKEILGKRLVKYPPGIKCPGSFFKNLIAAKLPAEILKNIPADKIMYGKLPAGALLEKVGAKGQSLDGIKIADYHANLFINQGSGTAKAFYDLAKIYSLKVKEKFGIFLEPEVQLVNLPPLI